MKIIKLIHKNKEWVVLFVILFFAAFLRFYNLGYSDYIPDETTVMTPIKSGTNVFSKEFILSQNKGPLQFWVAKTTSFFVNNPFNELAYRLPFAFANILAFLFLYLYVKNISNSKFAGYFAVLLFSLNGLTVAFGRIVQYQSLNMLFSISALYLYRKYQLTHNFKYSLFGTLTLVVSFFAHWDVLFVLPIVMYHLFLTKKDTNIDTNLRIPSNFVALLKNKKDILINIGIGLSLVLLFLIPYYNYAQENTGSLTYLNSRVGIQKNIGVNDIIEKAHYYRFFIELYNPFVYIYLFGILSVLSILGAKKYPYYFGWYFIVLFIFFIFVKRSGTHLYNIFLPFSIISGLMFGEISLRLHKYLKPFLLFVFLLIFAFLWFQNYTLFNEYSSEYPWERENLFNKLVTKKYSARNLTNNIVGFPINREWESTRNFIYTYASENKLDLSEFTYITNDNTSTASFFLDLDPSTSNKMFVVGVKKPQTFANDYKFSNIKGKKTLTKIKNDKDLTVSQIYLYVK